MKCTKGLNGKQNIPEPWSLRGVIIIMVLGCRKLTAHTSLNKAQYVDESAESSLSTLGTNPKSGLVHQMVDGDCCGRSHVLCMLSGICCAHLLPASPPSELLDRLQGAPEATRTTAEVVGRGCKGYTDFRTNHCRSKHAHCNLNKSVGTRFVALGRGPKIQPTPRCHDFAEGLPPQHMGKR